MPSEQPEPIARGASDDAVRPARGRHAFAFGGPWGAFALTIALPTIVFYLWTSIQQHGGSLFWLRSLSDGRTLLASIPTPTPTSIALYGGWFALQLALQLWVPGPSKPGAPLADGRRLSYRLNGWRCWWLSWGLVLLAVFGGLFPATVFYDELGPLLSTVVCWSLLYSVYLYWHGKRYGQHEHTQGSLIHDFFLGTSLNPRTRGFDHKLFCEARPGLVLWVMGDFSLAAKQLALHGSLSTPMIMVCAFHFVYVADYYLHEEAILSTFDIKHENFGFMLCFGDSAWVPFTYSLQALYLVDHPHALPWWAVAAIVSLNLAGYVVFRGANIQKHRFRADPTRLVWGKPAEVIRTARGPLLLASGYWGKARHINYLGDLLMGLAWCLPCGFGHLAPYFYIIYFTILLVLRERRDHEVCLARYGADWEKYTRKVRWRIVPLVY